MLNWFSLFLIGIQPEYPRNSQVAFNRWFLAITLSNNPGLRLDRYQQSPKDLRDTMDSINVSTTSDLEPLLI